MRQPTPFRFMHWAKTRVGKARWCLGASGTSPVPLDEFPPARAPYVEPNYHGTEELREALARAHGTRPENVLVSDGTSLANYAALTALAGPGEGVLVEQPTYAPLEEIPRFHGAVVDHLARRPENGWAPALDDIARRAADRSAPRLRTVALSRLHNPSGADLPSSFLEGLAGLADRHGFHVLLDEVYLDFLDGASPGHSLSPRFVTTGSLTKVWGFGALRVGWVIADPEVLAPMKELSLYLAVDGAAISQATAVKVLDNAEEFLTRAREKAARGARVVQSFVDSREDVEWTAPAGGITGFLHLPRVPDTASFAEKLWERGVNVAAGEFFDMPGWLRVSFGGPEDTVREGLSILGRTLDEGAVRGT